MQHGSDPYERALTRLAEGVVRHRHLVLVGVAVLTALAGVYAARTLRMNSDVSTLIGQDAPFRQDYREYTRAFPELDDAMLIVLDAASLDQVDEATKLLAAALLQKPDLIATVFAPSTEPFFRDHALLYLDEDDLDRVTKRLTAAQPLLAALAADPSLRGLFDQLSEALRAVDEDDALLPTELPRIANLISDATESLLSGTPKRIRWTDEMMASEGRSYRVIAVQGHKYFADEIATGRLIDGVRQTIRDLGLTPENGVRVRLTGMIPLGHEEQVTLRRGLALAAPLSVVLLAVILGFGLRAPGTIVAIFLTLFASLTCTTAWAMFAVGEFNTISSAFAILLIGLGDDFVVHIALRYEEELAQDVSPFTAIRRAVASTGSSIALCTLSSAAAFLSFVPTPYGGLAALGIITGGGMFISFASSLTVFPAILSVLPVKRRRRSATAPAAARLEPLIVRHAGAVAAASAALALLGISLSTQAKFDFNTLGMKDPASESMTTLRDLQEQGFFTDYSSTVLAPDLAAAEAVAARLAALPEVSETETPLSYLPQNQDEKLTLLEDTAFLLEPALHPGEPKPTPTAGERLAALAKLRERIDATQEQLGDETARAALPRLRAALARVAASAGAEAKAKELDTLVTSDLGEQLDWLRRALSVGPVGLEDLPASLRRRLISTDGRVRVVALPRDDVRDTAALSRFVSAVTSVSPRATGRPAIEKAIGDAVVDSFRIALTITFLAVVLILVIALRDPVDTLIALAPITLAAFLTVAFGVVADIPFNMANVVVIPLVLGLGVDNGIHVLMRFRETQGSLSEVMGSSTPRAVVLSTLTTLAAFGTLALSPHVGIRSMGVLLTVALLLSLLSTIVVLPALVALRRSRRGGQGPVAASRRG